MQSRWQTKWNPGLPEFLLVLAPHFLSFTHMFGTYLVFFLLVVVFPLEALYMSLPNFHP